jgi:tagatose 6-phosphate kinase
LPAGPDVLKLTADELADGIVVPPGRAWTHGSRLVPSVRELIVTAGPRGARAWTDGRRWTVSPPTQVAVNPAGAGDALTAGLVSTLAAGASLVDALREAVAWAAAKVRELDFRVDPRVVAELRGQVTSAAQAIG